MDKRNKAEQFRKARKNLFKRCYKIGVTSDAEMFILVKRKGKSYTFTNTNVPLWEFQKIDYSKTVAKTAADFEPTCQQGKKVEFSRISGRNSALSTLGIKVPAAPQLDLCLLARQGRND
ncbi:hypothetical protein BGZ60DRAFT_429414 [Tricladium varicosporioides]|nr:hypothetical protein BGZ60DRAFT_429414 [Hymenoscyphus varicosporioides]